MKHNAKVELELPLVLPSVKDASDRCVGRLIDALSARPGVERVHVKEDPGHVALLCLHYDPQILPLPRLREIVHAVGAQLMERYSHLVTRTDVPLHARSARLLTQRLCAIPGVSEANVAISGTLRLEYDRTVLPDEVLAKLLAPLGVDAAALGEVSTHVPAAAIPPAEAAEHEHVGKPAPRAPEEEHAHGGHVGAKEGPAHAAHAHAHRGLFGERTELVFAALAGGLLLAGWLLEHANATVAWLKIGFYVAAYACGGYFTGKEALDNIRARRFEIDTLMLVAAVGAAALGKWAEGALLLFLFSLGHSLEHFAMAHARKAIEALAKLAPETAVVRRGDMREEVSVRQLAVGDIVVVKPNERLPADGVVVKGRSSVNQAPVTGESVPVDKMPVEDGAAVIGSFERLEARHRVFAATVNGSGALEVMVARLASQSTMARMAQLVNEAETQRSPTQQFTERVERVFVPAVLALVGLLLFAGVVIDEPFATSFYRAMAVLVAASPCALAISVPSAVLSGVARAGRGGVLIKGGGPLEHLGSLTSIAFDKTGTLTEGRPSLTDTIPFGATTAEELLAVVLAVELSSDHPLALALVTGAREKLGMTAAVPTATDVKSIVGCGIEAVIDGETVYIAKPVLFSELANSGLPAELAGANSELVENGRTTMVVVKGARFLGLLGVMDTPRAAAPGVMAQLRSLGIERLIMISGDNQQVADAVAKAVGLTEAQGDLMPEQKVDAIKKLRAQHGKVAMVGDGVNDAPAMANATVGVAMGAAGSDVALEAADVALMADDLAHLPFAVGLSRRTSVTIKQNLWVSLGVVAVLVPATMFGLNIGTAVLFHEGSTVLVVINALRLLAYQGPAVGRVDGAVSQSEAGLPV